MAGAFGKFVEWFIGDREGDEVDEDFRYQTRSYGESTNQTTYAEPDYEPEHEVAPARAGFFSRSRAPREAEVVEMRPTRPNTSIQYPRSFKDAINLAEQFKAGTFLILDLQRVEEKERQRLVFFMYGVACGCDGAYHRINEMTFAFAPRSYGLQAPKNADYSADGDEARGSMEMPRFTVPG